MAEPGPAAMPADADAGSTHIGMLPDAAMALVFGCLSLEERWWPAALVCKQWHQLASSPQLLRELRVSIHADTLNGSERSAAQFMPRVRSLCKWLLRWAAGNVQQLDLTLSPPNDDISQEDEAEVFACLAAALAACCASKSLIGLRLDYWAHWRAGSWLLSLGSLRSLSVTAMGALTITVPLCDLTALEHLELGAGRNFIVDMAVPALPPGLTSLVARSALGTGDQLLRQVGALCSLRSLRLGSLDYPASSYSALSQLTSLTRLTLHACDAIPASLSQLTTLEHCALIATPRYLEWHQDDGSDGDDVPVVDASADSLDTALAPLTRLTTLVCAYREFSTFSTRFDRLPAALAGLGRLQQLAFISDSAPLDASLPAGPWLSSLATLVLPAAVIKRNLALLDTARRLSCLGPTDQLGDSDDDADTVGSIATIVGWAARHPSLRRVVLNCYTSQPVPAELHDACLDAVRRKSTLRIDRTSSWLRKLAAVQLSGN